MLRQAGGLSAVQERALDAIDRNTQVQARLVDDLIDSQRILLGDFPLEMHSGLVSTLIDEAVEECRAIADAKHVSLQVEHDHGIGPVLLDLRRFRQALSKLIANAVKFSSDGGHVRVTSRATAEEIVVSVIDEGVGIDAAHLPHVFERFTQNSPLTTRKQGGLGLGLSLARQIIELHGGKVDATSPGPSQGATLLVTLPRRRGTGLGGIDHDDDHMAGNGSAATSADGPLAGRRILVVEDDDDSREMLELILRATSAELVSFESARRAYDYIASLPEDERPDAVVSDIAMPDEDGYTFMRRVRQLTGHDHHRLLALAVTAFTRDEDRPRSFKAGFDVHLGKPIDADLLVETLRSALPPRHAPGGRASMS